ncbi:MAG: transcriptional repressor [Oscillospiraceae bacterium]
MKQTRNTPQRELIRGLLKGNFTHPTADEIYELARKESTTISRGTVYRNLNFLTNMGEIAKLSMPVGPDHYDCETQNHYHFLCSNCNRVLDTQIPYYDQLNLQTAHVPGCKTQWHRLILVGLCPDCNVAT